MEIKGHIIDTSVQEKLFENHLAQKDNLRIFFSGKFGSGKTTFLKNYFPKDSESYRTIHLFPVNYSVAENRDIFELVKADILMEIMDKYAEDVEFEKLDIGNEWAFYFYAKQSLDQVLPDFLKLIPKVGSSMGNIANGLFSLKKGLVDKRKEHSIDDSDEVLEFMKSLSKETGSIYEMNLITEIIKGLVAQLKGKESDEKRETVLLIDDLDRIDPAHLFRIMNVFSAHFDHSDGLGNKFGFDKIIFIADHENIKSIYHHFYGLGTDISGYLDKFFSTDIFFFSTESSLTSAIHFILGGCEFNFYGKTVLLSELSTRVDVLMILDVMKWICTSSSLSLRILKKSEKRKIVNVKSQLRLNPAAKSKRVSPVVGFSVLGSLFGSMSDFRKLIEAVDFDFTLFSDDGLRSFVESVLLLSDYDKHFFKVTNDALRVSSNLSTGTSVEYRVIFDYSEEIYFIRLDTKISDLGLSLSFKKDILKAIETIEKYGV